MGIQIIGTGKYLPDRVVTNDDLAQIVDTSDEWITTRTGIKTRRVETEKATWQMAACAAREAVEEVGLVLAGSALVVQEDIWGNRSILSKIGPGQTFAEVFACAPGAVLNVSVEAESAVTVMFLRVRRVLNVCPSACSHHSRIIRNLLGELAEKNLRLNEKLTHMGQRTTRAKLMSYFSAEAQRRGGYEFDIPFSRQQLADYLGVERSGLSLELGKIRREGLLDFHKSHFLLKTPEADSLSPSAR